jgi:hypothetical protein
MADSTVPTGNRAPDKKASFVNYEFAEPISYATFPLPTDQLAAPLTTTPTHFAASDVLAEPGRGRYWEDWDDRGKAAPGTAAQANFAPSHEEERQGGDTKKGVREKRAIWIVHGMGQQVPFGTLDSLTQGLLRVANTGETRPRLRTVNLGNQTLQRVELDVDGVEPKNGTPPRRYELHLYEAYWAPETEGVAKLKDVVSFLLDGGTRGLLNCRHNFQRAMFGRMEPFRILMRTAAYIFGTLLILLALAVINGVILAAGTAAAAAAAVSASKVNAPVLVAMPLGGYWPQLTALASSMTAIAFTFGTLLFLAELSRPDKLPQGVRVTLSVVTWIGLLATGSAIVITAAVMSVAIYTAWGRSCFERMPTSELQAFATLLILGCGLLVAVSMAWRAHLRSSGQALRANGVLLFLFGVSFLVHIASLGFPLWFLTNHHIDPMPLTRTLHKMLHLASSSIWVWPFLIALSAKIRTLLIEYAGDVAIYVTPNKLDRFDEVRTKIKQTVRDVASAIYLAREPGNKQFLYEQVAVVGHSLGSVIAYDTLNRLMLDDWLGNNHLGIANRTNSFVTFGSPLDKTAFVFTIQGTETYHVRERLAATVQPLIESYPKFRKFRWINVYSRNDVFSGRLLFYDLTTMQNPEVPPEAVHNLVDKDASVPLVAHVDYWKNELVWTELMQQIAP